MMKLVRLIFIFVLILAMLSAVSAEDVQRTATIVRLTGRADVRTPQGAWMPARPGMMLKQGDSIRTKEASGLVLILDGKKESAIIEVRENSRLALAELFGNDADEVETTLLDLAIGDILIKAKKLHSEKSKFEVKTPISFVGVRGTIFS